MRAFSEHPSNIVQRVTMDKIKHLCLYGLTYTLLAANTAMAANMMTFNWPTSGSFIVEQKTIKEGSEAKYRYDINITQDKASDYRQLTYSNFEMLSFKDPNGQSYGKERLEAITPMLAITALVRLNVDPEGNFAGADGMAEAMEAFLQSGVTNNAINEEELQQLRQAMSTPQMQQLLQSDSIESWNAWVGSWLKLPNQPGAAWDKQMAFDVYDQTIPFNVTYTQSNQVSKNGLVSWRMESTADTDALLRVIGEYMQHVSQSIGDNAKAKPFNPNDIEMVEQSTTIYLVTDPNTLMPHTVITESNAQVRIKGKAPKLDYERNEYTFIW